jgi:hypothetical protein
VHARAVSAQFVNQAHPAEFWVRVYGRSDAVEDAGPQQFDAGLADGVLTGPGLVAVRQLGRFHPAATFDVDAVIQDVGAAQPTRYTCALALADAPGEAGAAMVLTYLDDGSTASLLCRW